MQLYRRRTRRSAPLKAANVMADSKWEQVAVLAQGHRDDWTMKADRKPDVETISLRLLMMRHYIISAARSRQFRSRYRFLVRESIGL